MTKKQSRSARNIEWIQNNLNYPEGKFVGQPFKLAKFQKDIIESIYGNPHGTRRAIISLPRKCAKTTLAAALLLLHLVGPEALPNSQLYSAANSRDQAAILYALAVKMVLMSPSLSPWVKINETKKQLSCPDLGSVYRALSKDSATAQGLSPVFVVIDELGQTSGPRNPLYEALETASGAQANPLTLVISTQAPTDNDLLSILIDDAKTQADPRTVLKLYSCPPDVDPFSEEALKIAIPAWNDFINQKEIKAMQADAKRMPSREAEFRNLILNQRVDAHTPFISKSVWEENKAKPEDWKGKELFLTLDLSTTTDLTALTILHKNEDGKAYSINQKFWVPDDGLAEKSRADHVPYDIWAKNRYIETVPGRVIDYDFVASVIWDIDQNATIKRIGFDRYNIKFFRKSLLNVGFTDEWIEEMFLPIGQGFVSMGPAIRELEGFLLNGKINHGANPVLTWNIDSVKVISDPAGNRKFVKSASNKRIDGAVTLAMACGMVGDIEAESKPKQSSYLNSSPLLVL